MDDLIILERYNTLVEAEIAAGLLQAEGLQAMVQHDSAYDALGVSAFTPLVRVRESERYRAKEILRAAEVSDTDPLPGGHGVVRCPNCELEYCYFGRPRGQGWLAMPVLGWLLRFGYAECWRCQKCEHTWEDPQAGSAEPSQFAPNDPRPAYLLARGSGGMGLFLGLIAAYFLVVVGNIIPWWMGLLLIVSGLLLGRMVRHYVCSDPGCRARLRSNADSCPKCKKIIAGSIRSAHEHYARTAEVRREFHALRCAEASADELAGPQSPTKNDGPMLNANG